MKTVSLELSRKLNEAGYPQKSTFMWDGDERLRVGIGEVQKPHFKTAYSEELEIEVEECFASPTADEILDQLPKEMMGKLYLVIETDAFNPSLWSLGYSDDNYNATNLAALNESLADAAAAMWIQLKKESLL